MRSVKLTETIDCPHGCGPFEAERWSFINVSQDPQLKEAVLGGELNLLRCEQCHHFFYSEGDLIYLDEDAQLLIFVFARCSRAKQKELTAKMQRDYQLLKESLLQKIHLDFGPICVFGPEELKDVIEKEDQRNDESQVIAAAAAALGLQVARLVPQWARENNFPLYVPAGADETAKSFAGSARKVLESGLKSPLLKHFAEKMKGDGASAPKVYDDTEETKGSITRHRQVCR